MQVANLNDIAIAGHTWREIRDALKRTSTYPMCENMASTERLAYAVAFDGLKALFPSYVRSRPFTRIYDEYRDYARRSNHEYLNGAQISAFAGVTRIQGTLKEFLVSEKLAVTVDGGPEECIELTEKGQALRRQKHLRRLLKKEAGEKLAKVLAAAKAYNSNPSEHYRICRIVLFGSLLRPEAQDVGDIDICILTRLVRGGYVYGAAYRPLTHLSKVTPYLSVEPEFSLQSLIDQGEEALTIFDIDGASTQAAINNRKMLAQAINSTALTEQIWESHDKGK